MLSNHSSFIVTAVALSAWRSDKQSFYWVEVENNPLFYTTAKNKSTSISIGKLND